MTIRLPSLVIAFLSITMAACSNDSNKSSPHPNLNESVESPHENDPPPSPPISSLYHPSFFDRFEVKTAAQLWPEATQAQDRYEDDGRLSNRQYRLTPKADGHYPVDFNFIDVNRQFDWHTHAETVVPVETCFHEYQQHERQQFTIEVCQRVIQAGTPIPVSVRDQIYIDAEETETELTEPVRAWHTVTDLILLTAERTIRLSRRQATIACIDLDTDLACDANPPLTDEPNEPDVNDPTYSDLPPVVQALLEEVEIHSSERRYWKADYQHDDEGLTHIANALNTLAQHHSLSDPAIDLALNYIRAHNYYTYGDTRYQPTAETAEQLHRALLALSQMDGFFGTSDAAAIAQEGYAIAVQGQTFNPFFRDRWLIQHFDIALTMLQQQTQHASVINGNWYWGNAIFATLGVIDYTSSQSRSSEVYGFFTAQQDTILATVNALGRSELALWRNQQQQLDPFILANVIDALTRIYRLEKFGGDHNDAIALRPDLDDALLSILVHHSLAQTHGDITETFRENLSITLATYYATWTDRDGRDFCTAAFAPYCQPLDKKALFDETYQCSSSLRLTVRKEAMTQPQKHQVCQTLSQQEEAFHTTMQTQRQPVADDYNEQLEVVIFASSSDWKTYGGALYNVPTDNGGIYIEGDPSRAGNQARFFAYIAEWARDFEIWNLEHEYIHYLDGRYNLYGPFMHYPENRTTWWAEGLAEYLAHGDCFERGLSVIAGDRTPSLESILYLTYNSGANMVYSWSYSVHRYLNERGLQTLWLDMARALRQANRGEAMFAYEALLTNLINQYSDDYQHWVDTSLRASTCASTQGRAGHHHHHHRMH